MKAFLTALLFLSWLCSNAQSGYSVWYEQDIRYFPITFNGEKQKMPPTRDRIVFYDSLCFCYRLPEGRDPLKKCSKFGDRLFPHCFFYRPADSLFYYPVKNRKKTWLLTDSVKSVNWVYGGDTKMILGFSCNSATLVNQRSDTILVWYTPEIPLPYGPAGYMCLPGLVLEVFDQRTGIHVYAARVQEGDYRVEIPPSGQLIRRQEYYRLFPSPKSVAGSTPRIIVH